MNTTTIFRSTLLMIIIAGISIVQPAFAKKVAGVELAPELTVAGENLTLAGAGIRKKLFIKLYVGSLYHSTEDTSAEAIIAADEPMAIRLNILSDLLTRDKMVAALKDGFKKATGGNTEPVQPGIDQMIDAMQDKIRPGNVVTLTYEPGKGTSLMREGESVAVIEGLPFKQALFGIWLSTKPAQASLKKAMLGQ